MADRRFALLNRKVNGPQLSDDLTISGSWTFENNLTLKSEDDVLLTLEADTDNSEEGHNPAIKFLQDGGARSATIGLSGNAGTDSVGSTMTGSLQNSLAFHHDNATGSEGICFGIAGTTYLNLLPSGHVHLLADNAELRFGAGNDLQIWSDGQHGRLDAPNGVIVLRMSSANASAIIRTTSNTGASLKLQEMAAPNGDTAGHGQLWVKNTTPCQLWFTDDAGNDTQIV